MQDYSEVIPYDTIGIPIYIRSGWLSMYTNMRSRCHWHEDLEFIRIHNGNMCYWINGKTMLLKEGYCAMNMWIPCSKIQLLSTIITLPTGRKQKLSEIILTGFLI